MRTRNQSKRAAEEPPVPLDFEVGTSTGNKPKSRKASVDAPSEEEKLRKKGTFWTAQPVKRKKECALTVEHEHKVEESMKKSGKRKVMEEHTHVLSSEECSIGNVSRSATVKGEGVLGSACSDENELDWVEGSVSLPEKRQGYSHDLGQELIVEFTDSSSAQQKPSRRASAEDKELAELVHKVHLLCLLARGRIVDNACNDPIIQASLLSLLPSKLLKINEVQKLMANGLHSLVDWFSSIFHVRSESVDRGSFNSNLAFALQSHEGTAEEVAALSVALFRALDLPARFVCILDVASLRPAVDLPGMSYQDAPVLDMKIFCPLTTLATPSKVIAQSPVHSPMNTSKDYKVYKRDAHDKRYPHSSSKKDLLKSLAASCSSNNQFSSLAVNMACDNCSGSCATKLAEGPKRKGDVEFELEMEMALSSTSAAVHDNKVFSGTDELPSVSSSINLPLKQMRQCKAGESSVSLHDGSGAVWSRRTGPPLYWAEVYCSGETLTGRWVHVDAANAIIDGPENVEAAAAAFKRPLTYVVAFSGNGAKDVTRRYCLHWYKISPKRVNSQWWETVLAPLNELESGATGSVIPLGKVEENALTDEKKNAPFIDYVTSMDIANASTRDKNENLAGGMGEEVPTWCNKATDPEPTYVFSGAASRNSLEDMELATRALTEPLPTNQQAYRSHHLYAIEKWLTKNQILHPKGPVLGYCSGHPVYPRSSVQTLQTKQKWLREGMQVRSGEIASKVMKRSKKLVNDQTSELDVSEEYCEPIVELYGKWQLEPLQLPHAVNGIVPKNERGQVEVWSEKCLPPGTIHLRFPRLASVAKRLEIDFAPAMVGFEFRNGRSAPIFDGIVVCEEFKDVILAAYAEEEERRETEERKRIEAQALTRWFQLISSIFTRQRLQNSYAESSSKQMQVDTDGAKNDELVSDKNSCGGDTISRLQEGSAQTNVQVPLSGHEHVFPVENQSFDEKMLVRIKRCPCGFSLEVEEL